MAYIFISLAYGAVAVCMLSAVRQKPTWLLRMTKRLVTKAFSLLHGKGPVDLSDCHVTGAKRQCQRTLK